MIADTERLIDGFRGLPAGMDGSKEPPQTPSEAAWYATNVTFRGGNGPRTRPGFREIPPTYWRNPRPPRDIFSIVATNGTATVTTFSNHNYDEGDQVIIAGVSNAAFNGTRRIRVTGGNTFTFPSSGNGTVVEPTRNTSSVVGDGTTATVITTAAHGYATGNTVVVSGVTDAEFNGTYVITVTNATTFTYPSTVNDTATNQGTVLRTIAVGTVRRDVDSTYDEDLIDGSTSRGRYLNEILDGDYMQGSVIYQDPREGNPAQMIVVVGQRAGSAMEGYIFALNFTDRSCYLLNPNDPIAGDVPVYMTQAEKYLIIQTGEDEPRIYDGYILRRASYYSDQTVPIGKQMAYGQGRLFVAVNEGSEVIAGDLVFGGSTTNVAITSSSAANPTVITTASAHGFVAGDQITIQGHSSTPPINSTYTVATAPTSTTFTIPTTITSAGSGGFVSRFNAGEDSDLLRFTETTFLNEGGSFAPTGKVGRVTGLVFLPVQDTATGQGDLVAFCERGSVTFQVSAPRDQWKNLPGFQRVLFDNIGSVSDSIIPINGDLFFRSKEGNGIRTYRNARAEADGYGQTPISAEIDPVLKQDTQWMLEGVSFVNFENRLLMTCLPQKFPRRASTQDQADELAQEPVATIFNGIAVLDFQSSSSGRGKSAAVFDGVWTGIRIIKLIQGTFDGDPRCFALCLHEDDTGRRYEIWEITRDDEFDTPIEGRRPIKAGIVTKAFDFNDAMGLKKLIRCDLWFDDLGGGPDEKFECELAYRPDDYPNFTTWQRFERSFITEFLLSEADLFNDYAVDFENWTFSGVKAFGSGSVANDVASPDTFQTGDTLAAAGGGSALVSRTFDALGGRIYSFSVYAKYVNNPWVRLTFNFGIEARHAWFNIQTGSLGGSSQGIVPLIEDIGDGWFKITSSVFSILTAEVSTQIAFASANNTVGGSIAEDQEISLYGPYLERGLPGEPEGDRLVNLERGYAPQVKFPAPPRTANISTDVPAYLGHDFTLRINWTGRAHLGRLMLHGHRLVEAVGGGSL